MNQMRLLLVSLALITMGGCSSQIDSVEQKIADIDAAEGAAIVEAPNYSDFAEYNYSAQTYRSPFIPPSLASDMARTGGQAVRPDSARIKQFLEQFPLESLIMRGTIRGAKTPTYGLIEAPDAGILQVQMGEYLGPNDGRIVQITPTEIHIVEIVPDGVGGFIERPRSLILPGSTAK